MKLFNILMMIILFLHLNVIPSDSVLDNAKKAVERTLQRLNDMAEKAKKDRHDNLMRELLTQPARKVPIVLKKGY